MQSQAIDSFGLFRPLWNYCHKSFLNWLRECILCLNGFTLSPEKQLKVHTLHGPHGEEEQAALGECILKHSWRGHCWFLPGTGFTTHSMGLKAPECKGSSSKTWVKMSHLDTKWWGFLCAVNKNGQQKAACVLHWQKTSEILIWCTGCVLLAFPWAKCHSQENKCSASPLHFRAQCAYANYFYSRFYFKCP